MVRALGMMKALNAGKCCERMRMMQNWQRQPQEFLSIGIQGECAQRRTACALYTVHKCAQMCNGVCGKTDRVRGAVAGTDACWREGVA